MSFPALAWAVASKTRRAADKLVLLGLADRHNTEHDLAYPSIAWLCEFSGLDRKTVVTALDRLEADGLIADSGNRVGKTKQVKAYQLNLNSAENGPVKTELLDGKGADFSGKGPKNGTRNLSEPPTGAKAPSGSRKRAKPRLPIPDDWIPAEFGERTQSRAVVDSWPDGELEAQLEQFKANHRAKGNTFVDPQDAWSTWVLNTRRFGIGKPAPAKQYVSKSGHVYQGDLDAIGREAQRRADYDTYWTVQSDKKRSTGPPEVALSNAAAKAMRRAAAGMN